MDKTHPQGSQSPAGADPYADFALVYDDWQYLYPQPFCMTMRSRVLEAVREFSVPVESYADLGCGTGTFAAWWKERHRDWTVFGVDQSPAMIEQAKNLATRGAQKQSLMQWGLSTRSVRARSLEEMLEAAESFQSTRAGEDPNPAPPSESPGHGEESESRSGVHFSVQNIVESLELSQPLGLATCLFDGMNHILRTEELEAALAHVCQALEPAGLFFFDLVGEEEFAEAFTGAVVRKGPGLVVTAESIHFRRGTRLFGKTTFAIFREEETREGASAWRRYDAEISERCWTSTEVRAAIESSGLKLLRQEEIDPRKEPEFLLSRSTWLCRRPLPGRSG